MLRQTISALALVACGFFTTAVLADGDHGIASIKTEDIDLTYIDHVLAGRVGDRPVYATPLANEFGMRLQHRAGGIDFESVLRQVGDNLSATVGTVTADGVESEIAFKVTNVNAAAGEIKGLLGEKVFSVKISSETMNGNHYVNPRYDIDVAGKPYSFVLEGGEACIGCSVKLVFAVLSMLATFGTL